VCTRRLRPRHSCGSGTQKGLRPRSPPHGGAGGRPPSPCVDAASRRARACVRGRRRGPSLRREGSLRRPSLRGIGPAPPVRAMRGGWCSSFDPAGHAGSGRWPRAIPGIRGGLLGSAGRTRRRMSASSWLGSVSPLEPRRPPSPHPPHHAGPFTCARKDLARPYDWTPVLVPPYASAFGGTRAPLVASGTYTLACLLGLLSLSGGRALRMYVLRSRPPVAERQASQCPLLPLLPYPPGVRG
jgi:hypothetical protein